MNHSPVNLDSLDLIVNGEHKSDFVNFGILIAEKKPRMNAQKRSRNRT